MTHRVLLPLGALLALLGGLPLAVRAYAHVTLGSLPFLSLSPVYGHLVAQAVLLLAGAGLVLRARRGLRRRAPHVPPAARGEAG